MPCSDDVTVREPVARTPRSDMHWCSASITTPTPFGARWSCSQSATCLVSRSCTWKSRANNSTTRASFDSPRIRSPGRYPTCATPVERQQMVLAQRLHRDVLGQNEFVVPLVVRERGQLELPRRQHLGVRVRHPARGLGQVRALRVPAERDQQIGDRPLRGGQIDLRPAGHDAEGDGLEISRNRHLHTPWIERTTPRSARAVRESCHQ